MSRIAAMARRALIRAREQHAYAEYHDRLKRGRALRRDSAAWRENHKQRVAWQELYLERRKKRRALDRAIAKLPIVQVDQAGEDFIREREGCVLHPYNDSRGFATVGVGHLIAQRPVNDEDRIRYAGFDLADADALLARDLDSFEAAVADAFKGSPLAKGAYQHQFNAACSLAFNIGAGGFANSTVAHEIKAGHREKAADAFLLWDKPPELKPRRTLERALFLKESS
jgi:lysozyme